MPAQTMSRNPWKVAALLFGSGLCALVYQTVWLRQFRLIFGASTYATGAVLAIFMGGLGAGSAYLGKRADARERPLLFYGNLEVLIAAAAALSQVLLWLAAKAYFASGGSPELGTAGATLLRLFLATLVVGPATFLMGATLPAAARAVVTEEDGGRRSVALLYGVNTLGAVAGALLSTFVLLETFGNRATLLMAVLVNAIVGLIARSIGRVVWASGLPSEPPPEEAGRRPALHVCIASALVGFAFLLMELVWYRMLSPILGGTTYMFGLILAIALFGIGIGGGLYAMVRSERATAGAFAMTCSLEALAIAIPFALGDRLAVLANVLRGLGVATGFAGHVTSWTFITSIVVLPAAIVAGYQFPLLIALLGRGRENVARQVGAAYAWNTGGAIVGSLAGGFGLMPLLSAPGTWRMVTLILIALAAAAVVFALREGERTPVAATALTGVVALAAIFTTGPTAVWRHSGIGAARARVSASRNELQQWINSSRQSLLWDKDGRESSVALIATDNLGLIVNGKSDGSARIDAETMVMSGLLGAALHPNPRTSLVVGLGTGSTTGWLGRVPSMQRVETIELEPVVLDVARACDPVNGGAMRNSKVRITIADAREVLLTTGGAYDLIVSEPSNPYRAGVASLFTHEFYEAVDQRLARGGYLLQWIQSYSMHADTMLTIYATLTSVFPEVQTWWTSRGDLMLVASREPIVIDAAMLRARLATEPYRSAVHNVWRADTAEQFLGHLVANEAFARAAAKNAPAINTDDRTVVEFGFARSMDPGANLLDQLAEEAEKVGQNRPARVSGTIDWKTVDDNRPHHVGTVEPPPNLREVAERALAAVRSGNVNVGAAITALAPRQPIEAAVIAAGVRFREKRYDEAAALLQRAFVAYRSDPWPLWTVTNEGITLAMHIGSTSPARARLLHDALSQPFAVRLHDSYRQYALLTLAPVFAGCGPATLTALRAVEPNPFWLQPALALRADCYAKANLGALADQAQRDLDRFAASEPAPLVTTTTTR